MTRRASINSRTACSELLVMAHSSGPEKKRDRSQTNVPSPRRDCTMPITLSVPRRAVRSDRVPAGIRMPTSQILTNYLACQDFAYLGGQCSTLVSF